MKVSTKFWQILTPGERRQASLQFGLMLIGMVLETMSIGMVVPALALMTEPNLGARYPGLTPWLMRLGNPTHEQLVVGGMLALVVLYAVKSTFLGFLAWWQARFVFGLQANLSQRLFVGYLRQPYVFHLQRNSALLIRNAIGQVGSLVTVMRQAIILLTEIMVLTGISLVLLAVEPIGAIIVVSTLGLAGWSFNRFTRSHILRWGHELQTHEGLRIQHLQQGLGGAKDVKLLGREGSFLDRYQEHNEGAARVGQKQATLGALPRLVLELLAVSGLAALVLTMVSQHKAMDSILPTLGVFAAAAFRLMPSFNRVTEAIGCILYSLPVIDNLHSELQLPHEETHLEGPRLPLAHELVLQHVSFQYPESDAQAVNDVSLAIRRGTSVGFIGGSGAGKSTLIDLILGLLTPTAGIVRVDGVDIQGHLRGWQDQIGYVPQSIFLTDDTLRRNVAFGLPDAEIDDALVWRALADAQLDQFIQGLPDGLDTLVGERGVRLSGGQRQRIGIARALYHDPDVLVLDEATSSLDTDTERGVMDAVEALQGDKTLIIVAHRLSTVERCDLLLRFEHGRLVEQGTPADLLGHLTIAVAEEDRG
jgi:ATP-binding cassette, subfamily B, bacterial PglK